MSANAPEMPKGRIRQMIQAYRITKRSEPSLPFRLLAWFLVVGGVGAMAQMVLFGRGIIAVSGAVVFGLLAGLLAVLIVLGRRAEHAAYAQIEGQPGAAAGALQMLRRGFEVKPGVAFTRNQDLVHRVISRAGIVLVGEGSPSRVKQLLATEKTKHQRIAGEDAPVHLIVVGDGEGEVPLTKLVRHVQKMKKQIPPGTQTALMQKMKALDAMRPPAPMPRGPMPTSAKGARRAMRG
ncbi:MAG TPA: DUF4191 domain-containing protein [Aeromicrobium sp.]|nr:DUF4191 domain-containing protein [Aeromicrobium sp.]HKY58555.1 DUF4191 domain-containing protein [Aeromicrobium sp.]